MSDFLAIVLEVNAAFVYTLSKNYSLKGGEKYNASKFFGSVGGFDC
ncbi:MAG: hypothetical protein JWO40_115 [Candidatus Doudnabacteria bacterium]|nr:hypothetical protein [Candidatus Doudnabacteria bacterium]